MHWSEFQRTAERLAQGAGEGDWRSAISRGYYAVFHCVRDFLEAHGIPVGMSAQGHFIVYAGLLNCGHAALAAIGRRLDILRSRRGAADYDLLRQAFDQLMAINSVHEASKLASDFQAALCTVAPAQVAASVKQYLQRIGKIPKTP